MVRYQCVRHQLHSSIQARADESPTCSRGEAAEQLILTNSTDDMTNHMETLPTSTGHVLRHSSLPVHQLSIMHLNRHTFSSMIYALIHQLKINLLIISVYSLLIHSPLLSDLSVLLTN